jgi:Fe-S cluster assembly iron-binding protein IscA
VIITDGAKVYIEDMMNQAGVFTLRVFAGESGCCGPSFQLTLAESLENDVVGEINQIKVAIDPQIAEQAQHITLDVETYQDGPTLVLSGSSNCC